MHQLYRRKPNELAWELAPRDEELSFASTGYIHAFFGSQAEADRNATSCMITAGEYTKFEVDYYDDPVLSKQCRLGQAFVNECLPKWIVDPDLFHQRHPAKATLMIFERYIDLSR